MHKQFSTTDLMELRFIFSSIKPLNTIHITQINQFVGQSFSIYTFGQNSLHSFEPSFMARHSTSLPKRMSKIFNKNSCDCVPLGVIIIVFVGLFVCCCCIFCCTLLFSGRKSSILRVSSCLYNLWQELFNFRKFSRGIQYFFLRMGEICCNPLTRSFPHLHNCLSSE